MKLLLHTCCGPCFLGVWESLKLTDFEVTNFFYNPNIWPEEEFIKRKENLAKVTRKLKTKLIIAEYNQSDYLKSLKTTKFPDRCEECYKLRLEKTAITAKELGYDAFSTTLLVSPYQNQDLLKSIGEEVAAKFKLKFYYYDFRPQFRAGQEKAKQLEIYRQKYCGCEYSLNEK
jgi:hypothetical protein